MATSVSMMHQRYYSSVHMRNGHLYSRIPRANPRTLQNSLERDTSLKQGVSETLKEAALINIVAAVNEERPGEGLDKGDVSALPGSAIDSLSNTMAVISNLMNSRKRTVSIPRTSKVLGSFYLSKNNIQKKPVYYKHSDDEEVAWKEQQKAILKGLYDQSDSNMKNTQTSRDKGRPAKEVIIKSLPTTPHTIEYNLMHNSNQTTPKDKKQAGKSKERESESRSSVRKLGTLKGSEPRKVHKLAKCDAVDLSETETSTNIQDIFTALNPSGKSSPVKWKRNNDSKSPSTKSLPPMFTPKSAISRSTVSTPVPKSINSAIRGRHLSRSMTQRSPDSLYKRTMKMPNGYGFEKLAICNGINQDPDISNPVAHDSTKAPRSNKPLFSGIVTQKSNWKQKPRKQPLFSLPFRGISNTTDIESEALLTGKRVFFTETDDFHDAVKSAMNGNIHKHYEEVIYSITPTGKSSSMSGAFDDEEREDKHVQVVRRRYLSDSDSSDESIPDERTEEDGDGDKAFHDTRIIHAPVSTSVAYPPISASQLLRIQQKIIPANIKTDVPTAHPYFSTSSSITLHTLERQKTDLSRNRSFVKNEDEMDEIEIEVKEHVTEEPEIALPTEIPDENNGNAEENTEIHDIVCSPVGRDLSTAASKTHPESSERKSRDSFYKLVKAVDTHSYAEFEHKKLRRLPAGVCGKALDNQTTEFVKIKL